jgi:hypothetical protein
MPTIDEDAGADDAHGEDPKDFNKLKFSDFITPFRNIFD